MSRFVFIDNVSESSIPEKKATNLPKINDQKATLPRPEPSAGERFVFLGEGRPGNARDGATDLNNPPAMTQPAGESIPQSLGRNALRLGARALETTLGLPGDLLAGAEGLIRSITGFETPTAEGPRNVAEQGLSVLLDRNVRLPQYGVPTSTELRENLIEPLSNLFFGDSSYTQPQSDTERFVDNVVQDFITLALPGSLMKKGGTLARQAIKSFKVAGLSNLVPFLGEKLGLIEDEGTKNAVKLGSALAFQFIPSVLHPGNISWFSQKLKPADAKNFMNALNVTSRVHQAADSFLKTSGFNHPFSYFLFGKKVPMTLMALRGAGYVEKGLRALNESPALRRYVKLVFQNSLKNNTPLMLRNMRKADITLQRMDKQE